MKLNGVKYFNDNPFTITSTIDKNLEPQIPTTGLERINKMRKQLKLEFAINKPYIVVTITSQVI